MRNAKENRAGSKPENRAGWKPEKMTWFVLLAKEREITINTDNINDAVKTADEQKTDGERIVSIKIQR